MASLTLKGVPGDLLARLKREAADHRLDAEEWLRRVREVRDQLDIHTTTAEIIEARDFGRE